MLFYVLPHLCRVTYEELIPVELFEAIGTELWRTEIKSEQSIDPGDGQVVPLKLKCDSHDLLSALKELEATPMTEECGSDTRSISHHVTYFFV